MMAHCSIGKRILTSFPLNDGLEGWNLPVTTEQYGLFFSHINFTFGMYCLIFVDDVTELIITMTRATVKGQLFVGQNITA